MRLKKFLKDSKLWFCDIHINEFILAFRLRTSTVYFCPKCGFKKYG